VEIPKLLVYGILLHCNPSANTWWNDCDRFYGFCFKL